MCVCVCVVSFMYKHCLISERDYIGAIGKKLKVTKCR